MHHRMFAEKLFPVSGLSTLTSNQGVPLDSSVCVDVCRIRSVERMGLTIAKNLLESDVRSFDHYYFEQTQMYYLASTT